MKIGYLLFALIGLAICIAIFWIGWKLAWKDSDDDPHVK
ncbi:hypothetical protein MGWOODY_XGa2798 [hydrothermal vent metagenome]|uniref:Uncharacterized protein n=1 Tax=hydrothermal vent metagenome TaxID=652676 RepID=A0A170PRL9_9ZZZZ